jgi:hypothetical protein
MKMGGPQWKKHKVFILGILGRNLCEWLAWVIPLQSWKSRFVMFKLSSNVKKAWQWFESKQLEFVSGKRKPDHWLLD